MADPELEAASNPTTPCFKLFGTRIVAETPNNPISESSSGEKPSKPTAAAAAARPNQPSSSPAPTPTPATGLACPRCKSRETKFCYFNNYNVNQPRHFCRGCHRYWTAGGALRNVPVGAGRRKAVRPPSHSDAGGGVFGLSSGLNGVVVQQWLMSHDGGFPAKRPNFGGCHDRIR